MSTLYLITQENFGFQTIFDALDAGRPGVGRNKDTVVTDPAIPDIPALLALSWDAENPLTPLEVQPFIGGPGSNSVAVFASILTDENISSLQDFLDFGYAVYEIAPGGDLISEFEIPTLIYGTFSDGIPSALSGFIDQKIAVFGDDALSDRLADAGAIPVPLALSEVPAALQAGVIDGVVGTDPAILDGLEPLGTDFFTAEVGETGVFNIEELVPEAPPDAPDPVEPLPDAIEEGGLYVISAYPSFEITDGIIEASGDPDFRFVVPVQIFLVDDTGAYIDHAGQTWRIGDPEGTYAIPATTASKHTALLGGEAQALVGDGEDVADFWEYRADHREFFADWRIFEVDPASQTLSEIPIGPSGEADDGPNVLLGDAQDNDLFGLGGNDELRGNGGNDALDGGPGDDTAVFSGPQSAYTVRITPSGQTVEDRRPGNDGTDSLARIETLSFSGAEWQLEIFSGVGSLTEQAFREFVEVYIAYFNRAPDAEGLFFYGTAFANGTTLEASAQTFVNSPEYAATYPAGLSNLAFATEVYKNVLGRDPDQPGLDFWVPLLDSGAVTKGFFIVEVLEGAKAPIPPDADPAFRDQKLLDQAYLANKTDIGVYFAVTKGMSDVGNATSAMQTFGDQAASDVSGAVAAIDGFHADALDPETGEFLLELVGVVDDPFAA